MKRSGDTFKVLGRSLARIGTCGKQLVPLSVELSLCTLKFQIELRARLLRDIELVRSCLKDSDGAGYGCRARGRIPDNQRRRCKHSTLRGSKLAPVNSPAVMTKITLRSQTVSPNELP